MMTLIQSARGLVGALTLTACSTLTAAATPEALYQLQFSSTPSAFQGDDQGNALLSFDSRSIMKLGPDGSQLWHVGVPQRSGTTAFDSMGNAFVAGIVYGKYSWNTNYSVVTKVDSNGQTQELLREAGGGRPKILLDSQEQPHLLNGRAVYKFGTDGTLLWKTQLSPIANLTDIDIEVDRVGNVYAGISGIGYPLHVYKVSPAGDVLWHITPQKGGAVELHTDAQQNLYVTTFDHVVDGTFFYGVNATKYGPNGELLASAFYPQSDFRALDVDMDQEGQLVIAGVSAGKQAVRKLNSDLTEAWTATQEFIALPGYHISSYALDMDIDADNNIYVTGGASIDSANQRIATTKFDPYGNAVWSQWAQDVPWTSWGRHVSVHNGDVYVAGLTWSRWRKKSFIKYGLSNQPPVANAGTYTPQECTGLLTQVTLDGTASTDPDGDLLSYSWSGSFGVASGATATVGLPLGNNPVTLTVDDGNGVTDTATASILVQDTTPPLIDAGADQVVIAQNAAGTPFTLNYGVSDACGGTNVTVSPLLASYPIGSNLITATATDDNGNVASDAMTLTVAYASGDFLPPLKVGGVYKLGRTLPVKFQLFYADGSLVSTATPTLQLQQLSNNDPVGEPIDPQSSATTEPSNAFRFADDHYIYNLDTSTLSKGSYRLLVDLGDGNGYKTFDIGLK